MDNDYFLESISDGIANAISELFPDIECSGQDGYELLTDTFGDDGVRDRMKSYTLDDCNKLAVNIQSWFEVDEKPTLDQARAVIDRALHQWDG